LRNNFVGKNLYFLTIDKIEVMSQSIAISPEITQKLIATAQQAAQQAYAPYSQFKVGAALLTEAGNIFSGCNVENISYGLSMCAERNAIATAVAVEGGDTMKITAIVVVNHRNTLCSPCGACRQVIWEFGKQAIVMFQGNLELQTSSSIALLPEGFTF
jgi:cytidine deaminase